MPQLYAIKAKNISKRYMLGQVHTDLLSETIGRLFKRDSSVSNRKARKEFWALRDVSFEVKQGDIVGIVGPNGAGKSTLLKILSRITTPTTGHIEICGRVASLLEVGTGFHPELTGRENIFLNGAILGMTKAEIRKQFDEIVAFSEVDKFIDTPVKRYSSGMYVRLAFSIAAHLNPEILIIDEVLAVGDAEFQKKCIGKMGAVASDGRTVLFVSHNMSIISNLCSNGFLLKEGEIALSGEITKVISAYLIKEAESSLTWIPEYSQEKPFRYNKIKIKPEKFIKEELSIPANSSFEIHFDFQIKQYIPSGRLAFRLTNQHGITVLSSASTDGKPYLNKKWTIGRNVFSVIIPGNLLSPGLYVLTITEPDVYGNHIIRENIMTFKISTNGSLQEKDRRNGVILPILQWKEKIIV